VKLPTVIAAGGGGIWRYGISAETIEPKRTEAKDDLDIGAKNRAIA